MSAKLIKSRRQARAEGLPMYFTGKPCKYGHKAERYTSNSICSDCRSGVHTRRRAILLRAEARKTGVLRYYTGLRCANGHLAERLTCNAQCAKCLDVANKARYAASRIDGAEAEQLYLVRGLSMRQVAEVMDSHIKIVSAALRDRGVKPREHSSTGYGGSGFPRLNMSEDQITAQYEGQSYKRRYKK